MRYISLTNGDLDQSAGQCGALAQWRCEGIRCELVVTRIEGEDEIENLRYQTSIKKWKYKS